MSLSPALLPGGQDVTRGQEVHLARLKLPLSLDSSQRQRQLLIMGLSSTFRVIYSVFCHQLGDIPGLQK